MTLVWAADDPQPAAEVARRWARVGSKVDLRVIPGFRGGFFRLLAAVILTGTSAARAAARRRKRLQDEQMRCDAFDDKPEPHLRWVVASLTFEA